MSAAAAEPFETSRGSRLLLAHVAAETPDPERSPAPERLEREVGGPLTRLLLGALAGDHRMRSPRGV